MPQLHESWLEGGFSDLIFCNILNFYAAVLKSAGEFPFRACGSSLWACFLKLKTFFKKVINLLKIKGLAGVVEREKTLANRTFRPVQQPGTLMNQRFRR